MKQVLLILSVIALASAYNVNGKVNKEDYGSWELQPYNFSPAAKAQLQRAGIQAIAQLCLGEEVNEEIMNTICSRAIYTKLGKRSGGQVETRSCWDCSIADPICFNSCPQ